MQFDKFLGRLDEGRVQRLDEKTISGDNWFYAPDQKFLNGNMRVAVEELGDDKWQIHYFAPGDDEDEGTAEKASSVFDHKDIEKYMKLSQKYINEGRLDEGENDKEILEGWTIVVSSPEMDFATTLQKCVALVEGDVDSDIKGKINQYTQK